MLKIYSSDMKTRRVTIMKRIISRFVTLNKNESVKLRYAKYKLMYLTTSREQIRSHGLLMSVLS